jgi:hypothetical protein
MSMNPPSMHHPHVGKWLSVEVPPQSGQMTRTQFGMAGIS